MKADAHKEMKLQRNSGRASAPLELGVRFIELRAAASATPCRYALRKLAIQRQRLGRVLENALQRNIDLIDHVKP